MPSMDHPGRGCECPQHVWERQYQRLYHRLRRGKLDRDQYDAELAALRGRYFNGSARTSPAVAERIETAIARGLPSSKIMAGIPCNYGDVARIRARMENRNRAAA